MKPSTHTRRQFVGRSISGLAMLGLGRLGFASQLAHGPAKRCVVLWMDGGPSQLETFDPKPGTSTGGPTRAIPTSVPGIQIAEHLPRLAQRVDRHAILRSLTSSEGDHVRARYYLRTGFEMVAAFPRPAIGSVVSHQLPDSDLPKYVVLGESEIGPAYCGPQHQAFMIQEATTARELLGRIETRQREMGFLTELNHDFDQRNESPEINRRSSMISRIQRMVTTPFREALQIESESESTRQRYGDHQFGRRCLTARRLLQRGVPMVEVQLGGWDTHTDNFNQVARLAGPLDQGWSALVDDLVESGLWEDSLIVWMGEFGRTPVINGQSGRDHFPAVTPVVLGGGAVAAGRVVGATNHGGTGISGASFRVADLSATVLHLLGIDPRKEFQTSFDSPTTATDDGTVIDALVA